MTIESLREAVTGRAPNWMDEEALASLAVNSVTEYPPTMHVADAAADVAGALEEITSDLSGTAEEAVDRAADSHPARGALIEFLSHALDEEGGDHWGTVQLLRDAASCLEGAARDLA